nr:hypothetical protein [Tanacetum cinerariifolium]
MCQEAMGDVVAQTRSERVFKISNDPLLAGVNTPQSGENSLKLTKLMELYTNLQQRVFALEATKTTQAQEIVSLKRRVKKFKKKQRSRTHKLKSLHKVGFSARAKSSDEGLGKEDASKQESIIEDLNADKNITLVNDQEMFDADKDLHGEEVVEEQQELNEEEKAKLFMELLEKRRKFFSTKRTEEKRNKPPTKAQQRSLMWKKRNYQIIRAGGRSKNYLVFSYMLKDFDKEDVETLWKLVQAKYGSIRPEEDYDRVLWGDLKVMFVPYVEEEA